MTSVAIVQARMGSSRLPGKVMMALAGRTVLAHVLLRCAAIEGIEAVCCAVPDEPASEALAAEAESCGAVTFRGSEGDVLGRYAGAAAALRADIVLRVTSDCPLIDPAVCAKVLALRAHEGADYAANNLAPGWPHGLDCEAFTADLLARAAREALSPYEREHVTPWMRRHPGVRRANLPGPGEDWAEQRWTLDYPEDLAFFRALFAALACDPAAPPASAKVMACLRAHPEIAALNRARRAHLAPQEARS